MYGLVNKAIEDLVVSNFGEDKWEAIKAKAGVDVEVFVSNEAYPDDITYNLVGAASEENPTSVSGKVEQFSSTSGPRWRAERS